MAISPPHNILIVKLSAIGDVIHALPVAHVLKRTYPAARITWIVEKSSHEILTNNPNIDGLIVFEKAKYKTISGLLGNSRELAALLQSRKFDLAIDLQGLFKSAVIVWLSKAKTKLGYCNMRELSQYFSTPVCGANKNGHVIDRYLDVAAAIGCDTTKFSFDINVTTAEIAAATAIAADNGLEVTAPYIVLAPGTNWQSKCWPAAYYAELAIMLHKEGLIPVLIGGPGDRELAGKIKALGNEGLVDLIGKTSLKELAYIIKKAQVFVGGDTGPMHLAVAVGTKVVSMFGPTSVTRNGPYWGENKVLTVASSCAECWKRTCPKNKICLEQISVINVKNAIESIMKK